MIGNYADENVKMARTRLTDLEAREHLALRVTAIIERGFTSRPRWEIKDILAVILVLNTIHEQEQRARQSELHEQA